MSLVAKMKGNKLIKDSILSETAAQHSYISTGCLVLNVLYSGKFSGGITVGKLNQIVAPSAHAKSFIGMKVAANAQKLGMEVMYMDTEMSYDYGFAQSVGVDSDRMLVVQDNHIESVQQILITTVELLDKDERKNLLIVLDSWGAMITSKTYNDAVDGKDVTDMTVAKKKNSLARILTGLGVTVFVINQVYDTFDKYNPLAVAGGRGLFFASSSIVMATSKAKDKSAEGEISGAIVTANTKKSRFCRENSKLKFLIKYDGGIDPYYGILEDAIEGGYVIKPTMGFYTRPSVEGDKKWRLRALLEQGKDFWHPILTETDFPHFIERKYSFDHSDIVDEDFEIGNIVHNIDTETGEVLDD